MNNNVRDLLLKHPTYIAFSWMMYFPHGVICVYCKYCQGRALNSHLCVNSVPNDRRSNKNARTVDNIINNLLKHVKEHYPFEYDVYMYKV